jgi:hypothetical protein
MSLLSGIEGAIGDIAGAFDGGGSGGGNFLSELLDAFGGGQSQGGSGSEIGQIAQAVLPLALSFL